MPRSGRFIILLIFCLTLFINSCNEKSHYREVRERDGLIVLDITGLKDTEPLFYSYRTDKKVVDFFVIKIGDRIESYLDACMKCYPHKMGFRVDGFYLVCKYCNVRYPLDRLKEGAGSCYPIPLKGEVMKNQYVIKARLLQNGAKYF
ncbi:MAG TPA: DUF2318 domain-containing protein [Nitrospirae bacterium]|nr:DUF2318 domain-containing protein [Nitrospirota bacterium]